jgi:hypothetical protein
MDWEWMGQVTLGIGEQQIVSACWGFLLSGPPTGGSLRLTNRMWRPAMSSSEMVLRPSFTLPVVLVPAPYDEAWTNSSCRPSGTGAIARARSARKTEAPRRVCVREEVGGEVAAMEAWRLGAAVRGA